MQKRQPIWGKISKLSAVLLLTPTLIMASPSLHLKQVIELVMDNNKDLKAARHAVFIAQGRLVQAGLWSNPSINLSNNDDTPFSNEGEYTRSVGFSQAFPISGRLAHQKKVARIDVAKALIEIQEAQRKLSATAANAFYALMITQQRIQQLNYLSKLNQQLVEVTQNRLKAAEVSKLDSNTAFLEYLRIKQEKELLQSTKISQMALLNQLMGRPHSQPLDIKTTLPILKTSLSLNSLQDIALRSRPDIQALRISVTRSQAERQLVQAERFADWSVGVAVQQERLVVQGAPTQTPERTLGVNLSIPLPLLNGNQGRLLETSATGTQALLALNALTLTIKTEVASNYAQLMALQRLLDQMKNTSFRLANANVTLAQDAYKNGQLSLFNVMQVQRQQSDLQLNYFTTLEKVLQNYVALCTAIRPTKPLKLCEAFHYKRNFDEYTSTLS